MNNYYLIDGSLLPSLLNCEKENILDTLYILNKSEELVFYDNNHDKYMYANKNVHTDDDVIIIEDPIEILTVLAKTINNLYIPNHPIMIDSNITERKVYFLREDFDE